MAGHQCLRCRLALRQAAHIRKSVNTSRIQTFISSAPLSNEFSTPSANDSTKPPQHNNPPKPQLLDIDDLLSKPTWSVRSLLPPSNSTASSASSSNPDNDVPPPTPTISPAQLHHLLRLSALPQPRSPSEEASMLSTLSTQLHFVRAIRGVDTTGVEPLVTIRDETEQAVRERTIGLQNERIREALRAEKKVGRMGRVRRVRRGNGGEKEGMENGEVGKADRRSEEERAWEPLEGAKGRTVGRWFVVESGRGSGKEEKSEMVKE